MGNHTVDCEHCEADLRARSYIHRYGRKSWELDALDPKVIDKLIRKQVDRHRDADLWNEKVDQQREECETLDRIIENLE